MVVQVARVVAVVPPVVVLVEVHQVGALQVVALVVVPQVEALQVVGPVGTVQYPVCGTVVVQHHHRHHLHHHRRRPLLRQLVPLG